MFEEVPSRNFSETLTYLQHIKQTSNHIQLIFPKRTIEFSLEIMRQLYVISVISVPLLQMMTPRRICTSLNELNNKPIENKLKCSFSSATCNFP